MTKQRQPLFTLSEEDKAAPALTVFNTNTIFDLLTGDTVRGYDGKWYVRGGLGTCINGLFGKGNSFKSGVCDALTARLAAIYGGDFLIVDTEGIKTPQRMITCAGELGPALAPSHFVLKSGVRHTAGDILAEVKAAGDAKISKFNDYTFETPFVDPMTRKRIIAWIPTVVYIDSLTEMHSVSEISLLDKEGLEGGKAKTLFMEDGRLKTVFNRNMRRYCEMYGMVFVGTAHMAKEVNMEMFSRPSKQLATMKPGDKIKGAGSNFYTLPRFLFCNLRSVPLHSADGKSEYAMGNTPDDDVQEVQVKVIRCKSNQSGPEFPVVTSQFKGMLTETTHYHMLRRAGYYGLTGNKQRHQPCFTPDKTISRNTMRQAVADDYELRRAMEICAHLLVIQTYWQPIPELDDVWHIRPEDMYEMLQKSGSAKVSDILNSVGYWYPDGTCDRPYLSIFDILELIKK